MAKIHNRLFAEILPGERVSAERRCGEDGLDPFELASELVQHRLPGPGARWHAHSFSFHEAIEPGEAVIVSLQVVEKREPDLLVLELRIEDARGTLVADGVAEVLACAERQSIEVADDADVLRRRPGHFDPLLAACEGLPALPTAVIWPDDAVSLEGALAARDSGLIDPILIGRPDHLHALAAGLGHPLGDTEIHAARDAEEAARLAIPLAREGRVQALMKGSLHSDTLLAQVVSPESGLRADRRVSHVFVMDTPGLPNPLFISDAAINIAPDLMAKVDITQNAINLARACGLSQPRVAILSAVETVNPNIPSTLDAAALSKMADRGQITGAFVDGPLAMDNAIDLAAARTKGIQSPVAGRAQVLIMPNLEAGNMLAKELSFLAHAQAAGLVLGARVPVMLTSRADDVRSRLVSCALAQLLLWWQRTGASRVTGSRHDA